MKPCFVLLLSLMACERAYIDEALTVCAGYIELPADQALVEALPPDSMRSLDARVGTCAALVTLEVGLMEGQIFDTPELRPGADSTRLAIADQIMAQWEAGMYQGTLNRAMGLPAPTSRTARRALDSLGVPAY